MPAHARSLRIALLQTRVDLQPEHNLAHAEAQIREAARRGARVVCLPELFASRYFCQREDPSAFDLAEPVPGPTTARLSAVAKECGVVIVASLFERRAPGLYHNTAAVLDADGSIAGVYRKMHIPDDPLYYEKYYFAPGDLGFLCIDTQVARLGVLVCWDQWYPEAARLAALAGAEILIYPTAIGWHPAEKASHGAAQYDAWFTIQRAHAIANGVFVASINRTGFEDGRVFPHEKDPSWLASDEAAKPHYRGIDFWGGSFVAAPTGEVIERAPHEEACTMLVDCDLSQIETTRQGWPFFRDRRIDAYGGLTRRWNDKA